MKSETVTCQVCPHFCTLREGQTGRCRGRKNVNGKIIGTNYGVLSSIALDPIEKKPLYNFYPGSQILSVGGYGCNFNCPFCQNYSISMTDGKRMPHYELTPQELVDLASKYQNQGNIGIAFTYNEPLINYEYITDTFKLAKEKGLKTVIVSNGGINPEIFEEVAKVTDAFNIDLKGIDVYNQIGGDLETVKKNIKIAKNNGSHVEVTTLVIPDVNDSIEEIDEIASYIGSIDKTIPLHLSRFFPNYKMQSTPPTPINTLVTLKNEAENYLDNVYLGNV